ncbi:MAG TPA: sugar ABC transporter permease [Roseiflexaceae bacterium]|nr:sugar ABC transporter permease [Roseiflexaceae bacterium]
MMKTQPPRNAASAATPELRPQTRQTISWWDRHAHQVAPYLFLLPFFLIYGIFFLYPVVSSFILSFYKAIGLGSRTFIGIDNYVSLASDPRYRQALINTTLYTLASVFILSPLALVLALMVRSFIVPSPNLKSFYRVIYFLPNLTSFVVIALMFALIFNKDFGLLNQALASLGIPKVGWLRETTYALPSIILVAIWTFVGLNSLYFLAGLQAIPEEINEAASIDGATRWQTFWRVTIPLLRPTILFVIVQAVIFSYQLFDLPYLLTAGGPSDATLTIAMYLYVMGFTQFNLGYAAAIGYSLAVIAIVVSLIQFGLFRLWGEE